MGFAVVADEVRALAKRSAQAAKETAALIEDSIGKSSRGVTFSAKVAASLADIVTKARQMDELINEIAAASSEQTLGITQINSAITHIDSLTQEAAGSSANMAQAASGLREQSGGMKEAIAELEFLIGRTAVAAPVPPDVAATVPTDRPVAAHRAARSAPRAVAAAEIPVAAPSTRKPETAAAPGTFNDF